MHVMLGVSEYYPLVKVGGLGDFAGSYARCLARKGQRISVALPGYASLDRSRYPVEDTGIRLHVPISDREVSASVSRMRTGENLDIYLVEHAGYFDRPELFGNGDKPYPDNAERFLFFSRCILELLKELGDVDILHVNDWHTAIALFYLEEYYRKLNLLEHVRTVLTIHNLGYQGMFWHHDMHLLNVGWQYFTPDKLEFYNHINYLKSGIIYADAITTVSPTYAAEIQTPELGFGLDGVLRSRSENLSGILNGVDYREWNPWTDKCIPARFSPKRMNGKDKCKQALLAEMGLESDPDRPLITMVSRLADQKGMDLVLPVFDMIMDLDVQFLLLGSGKRELEDAFRSMEARYRGRAASWIGYDECVARRVYAGGDLFLMPSRYEPCGLSQLYAMKYGNVPVVRMTGGLRDTVTDLDEGPDRATGFGFEYYSPYMLYETIQNAVTVYREDRSSFNRIAVNAMEADFSWDRTVSEYLALYRRLRSQR